MSDHLIVDPFHRKLYELLAADINNRMTSLAAGSCGDFATYKHQTGYIEALNDVLEKCREIEVDQYGARPGAAEQAQED